MVTQSTGNHGIAVIKSVYLMKIHYVTLYPEQEVSKWNMVYPCHIWKSFYQNVQNTIKWVLYDGLWREWL